MDHTIVYVVLILNMCVSIVFFIEKKCEIPFFIAFFNLLVEYRFIAIKNGFTPWVDFDYGIAFIFNNDQGAIVSNLIVLGSSVLMYSFIFFFKPSNNRVGDNNALLKEFIALKKKTIIAGLVLFTIFQIFLAGSISQGYGNLSKLGNTSFIILLFLTAYFTEKGNIKLRLFYFVLFILLGMVTYSTALRFQFLGWIVPIGYYLTRSLQAHKKIIYFFASLFVVMIIFSSAGVLRDNNIKDMSWSEFYGKSRDRLMVAEDINFIDGFIMVHQIYPQKLDYTYGIQHLEILFRPIPRTIWPNKPLAGWVQNYSAKYNTPGYLVGFSPTIYGVFFSEAGIIGIIFFSIMWGRFLSYLYGLLAAFKSSLWAILVGVLLASLIPIFRSGDLAGDVAIVLVSYWPLIVFVNQYKKFLIKKLNEQE